MSTEIFTQRSFSDVVICRPQPTRYQHQFNPASSIGKCLKNVLPGVGNARNLIHENAQLIEVFRHPCRIGIYSLSDEDFIPYSDKLCTHKNSNSWSKVHSCPTSDYLATNHFNMSKKVLFSTFSILLIAGCAEIQQIGGVILAPETTTPALTEADVTAGLKEALVNGTKKAVGFASSENGYFKNPALFIPFPPEAQKVKDVALQYGLQGQVDQFEMTLNRAAEKAAPEATTVFVNAITQMTVADAFGILNGGEHSATNYLKEKTTPVLISKFKPHVSQAIESVELTKYWNPLISKYNIATMITGGQEINPDLDMYVTEKGVDGLFVHIASEEALIRKDPKARVTELLQRVFGSIMN